MGEIQSGRVGTLGPVATNSDTVAKTLRPGAEIVHYSRWIEVFEAVASGEVDEAVIAIENSIGGWVERNPALLLDHENLWIRGEYIHPIDHALIVNEGTSFADITRVHSYPQALDQCFHYLKRRLPKSVPVAALSTVAAVEGILGDPRAAAIAPPEAAALYGCEILEQNIQDEPMNETRFLVLGKSDAPASSVPELMDKTSIAYNPENSPGRLVYTLNQFGKHMRNIISVSSQPMRGRKIGTYWFMIDFEGHRKEPEMETALHNLTNGRPFRILGSYPAARPAPENRRRD